MGLFSGLPIGLAAGLLSGPLFDPVFGLLFGIFSGLSFGLIVTLRRGGSTYVRHHLLRSLLIRNRSTPRNYMEFLDYAAQLTLLRRLGGDYEFAHRLLLEHFAVLESSSLQGQSSQGVSPGSPADSMHPSATPTGSD